MDILLIENDPMRRVAVGRHLALDGHRVTLSSSVKEAREIMRFVVDDVDGPEAVVIAAPLDSADCGRFHDDMSDRFPDVSWVLLREDLTLDWLQGWLAKTSRRMPSPAHNVVRFPVERVRCA
jgi:DNA-binding NtrC family response regulator